MNDIFRHKQVNVDDCIIDLKIGGNGPPLLLLHGFPETKMAWNRVGTQLASEFTIVMADLPGYGDSVCKHSSKSSESHSKRNAGLTMQNMMHELGFDSFAIAGHDRGGRVAYRMAMDSPAAITRLAVLNIIPTLEVVEGFNYRKALNMENWVFLAQPFPFPETLINANPVFYLDFILNSWSGPGQLIPPDARNEYIRCFKKPDVIANICEEYRATLIDASHDETDRTNNKRISSPTLILWSERDFPADSNNPLYIWNKWATNVMGKSLPCGHFLMEEMPEDVFQELRDFFI